MLLLVLAMCLFILADVGAQHCHQDWMLYEESCYGFGEDPITWAEAQAMCRSFDSKLAEIETPEENEFLKNMAVTKHGAYYWIGATDVFHEGVWEWASTRQNVMSSFTDWIPGSPGDTLGGYGQDCMCMDRRYGYQWNDGDCEAKNVFICEAVPSEEPVVG